MLRTVASKDLHVRRVLHAAMSEAFPVSDEIRCVPRPVFLVSHGKRGRGSVTTSQSGDRPLRVATDGHG